MADLFTVDEGGEPRRLGTLPATTAAPQVLSQVFGGVGNAVMIPRSDWKPVSLKQFFPRIKDQDGVGMCNCSATGNIVEGCRRMAGGLADTDLSAGDLYHRISGGVDQGSLPEDALREAMVNGMAPTSDVPYLQWKQGGPTTNRKRFRITEAYWCPTFDHGASALQQGFLLDIGIWWYGRDPLDADGWLAAAGTNGRGGHALCGLGLAERNGSWGFQFAQSWGTSWYPQFGSFGIMPEARAAQGMQVFQCWACRGVVEEGGTIPAPTE